jgi:glycosyltransferase involved in cell wall biosynthesis
MTSANFYAGKSYRRRLKVLILHDNWDLSQTRRTSFNHAFSLLKYAPWNEYELQTFRQPVLPRLRRKQFDAILIDTTFLCWRWALPHEEYLERLLSEYAFVSDSDAVKIALPQDEYDQTARLDDWLASWRVDLIYSVCYDHRDVFYPNASQRAEITEGLTGYIDDADIAMMRRFARPFGERDIDVGYRAKNLPAYFGRFSRLKAEIGERFLAAAQGSSLRLNISLGDASHQVLLGDEWLKFLGNCRFTLGCESGSSLLDPRGEIRAACSAYLREHPDAGFDEVEAACFPGRDMKRVYSAISPRVFEAALAEACQVLVPGHYLGILHANEHYIPLAADFSNIAQVLDELRDCERAKRRIVACQKALLGSERLTYRGFVGDMLERIEHRLENRGAAARYVTIPGSQAELMHELVTLVVRTTASGTSDEDLHDVQAKEDGPIQPMAPVQATDLGEVQAAQDTPVPPVATAQSSYLQHVQATDGTHVPQLKISAARDLQETNVTQGASGVTLLAQSGNESQSMQDITEKASLAAPRCRQFPLHLRAGQALRRFPPSVRRLVPAPIRNLAKLWTSDGNSSEVPPLRRREAAPVWATRSLEPPTICILAISTITDDPRVRRQAEAFHRAGWKVVAVGIPGGKAASPEWPILTRDNAPPGPAELPPIMLPESAQQSYWKWFAGLADVYRCAQHVDATVWLANDWNMLPIAATLARDKGGLYGYDTHEFATEEYAEKPEWCREWRPIVSAIEQQFIAGAVVVSAVSSGIADGLHKLYQLPRPVLTIRNTCDFEDVRYRPTERDRIRVLYHGIVVPNRGIEASIESVVLWRPEITLTIRGPENPQFSPALREQIAKLGVADRVELAPPVPMTALVREAALFDIGLFALPGHSRHNEFALPNKFFEYLMAGLALCTTDLPEMASVISKYDMGVTIARVAPDAIAAAVNSLTPDRIEHFKRNSLAAARELCWERESQHLVGAYGAALAGRVRARA